jgi:hypothetical protein
MATTQRLGALQWAVVLLTIATAFIHIWLALQFPTGIDPVFMLNGLGYLTLLALLYLPIGALARYRAIIRWVLIAYTATTVILWLFPSIGARSPIAYVTKTIEVALIICLWFDRQQARVQQKGADLKG